jgi:putative glycosyltransferase (TIGR04348 family)
MVALHAGKSAGSARRFRSALPASALVVALTGTDVYRAGGPSARGRRALAAADAIVALQPLAARELPGRLRPKVRTILQSAAPTRTRPRASRDAFEVAVAAHLRRVKDPFRAALAASRLPAHSRVRVVHAGAALTEAMEQRARRESATNPRWRWAGDLGRPSVRRLIARSRALVAASLAEGGSSALSEAIVDGVPVIASRIPGTVGVLGPDYPGYFPTGDTRALAHLLLRAETDRGFLEALSRAVRRLASRFEPARELAAWRSLLAEIGPRRG